MAGKVGTKEKIVRAAWKLFREKGYENTTVEDIIIAAKTSKGSFYYYFERKDSLLDTLSTLLDQEYERLQKEIDPDLNSYDKLIRLNYEMHTFIEEEFDADLLASLYSTQLLSKGNSRLLDQNRVYYRFITDIIEDGQKRGEITKSKSVREITKFYSLCERALISDWCLSRGSYSLAQFSKEYMPLMMQAMKES
jgi:Transcriptional regulator